jgi:hypothetical protein
MTVKIRGIQLKKVLSPADQGQRKLIQVTYSQLAALGAAPEPQLKDLTASGAGGPTGHNRRRAIARMLRIELEETLALLDEAIENVSAVSSPAEPE